MVIFLMNLFIDDLLESLLNELLNELLIDLLNDLLNVCGGHVKTADCMESVN